MKGGGEDFLHGFRHPAEAVRDEHPRIPEPSLLQASEEILPELGLLRLAEGVSDNPAVSLRRDPDRDEDSFLLHRFRRPFGPFEGNIGRIEVDERAVLDGIGVELRRLSHGFTDDPLDGGGGNARPFGLGERLHDVVLAHPSAVEAHDLPAEVTEVMSVPLQQIGGEGEEPCPRNLYLHVAEAGPYLPRVVAVPGSVLLLQRGLLGHGEELLGDRPLDEELIGRGWLSGDISGEGLGSRPQVGGEEASGDDPPKDIGIAVDDSLEFVLAKPADLSYTSHGAVCLSF